MCGQWEVPCKEDSIPKHPRKRGGVVKVVKVGSSDPSLYFLHGALHFTANVPCRKLLFENALFAILSVRILASRFHNRSGTSGLVEMQVAHPRACSHTLIIPAGKGAWRVPEAMRASMRLQLWFKSAIVSWIHGCICATFHFSLTTFCSLAAGEHHGILRVPLVRVPGCRTHNTQHTRSLICSSHRISIYKFAFFNHSTAERVKMASIVPEKHSSMEHTDMIPFIEATTTQLATTRHHLIHMHCSALRTVRATHRQSRWC